MANYRLYAVVFFKTLHLQSSFAGTTIRCLLCKQPQEVQKSDRWLRDLWYSQGLAELDQGVVIQMSVKTGFVKGSSSTPKPKAGSEGLASTS
jgi:hypothetical protein